MMAGGVMLAPRADRSLESVHSEGPGVCIQAPPAPRRPLIRTS